MSTSTVAVRPVKRLLALACFALLSTYLLFYPVSIDPTSWTPPPNPGFAGRFAPTSGFGVPERSFPSIVGPEAMAWDAEGRLYTGLLDGRVIRIGRDRRVETFVRTGGRPLSKDSAVGSNPTAPPSRAPWPHRGARIAAVTS